MRAAIQPGIRGECPHQQRRAWSTKAGWVGLGWHSGACHAGGPTLPMGWFSCSFTWRGNHVFHLTTFQFVFSQGMANPVGLLG